MVIRKAVLARGCGSTESWYCATLTRGWGTESELCVDGGAWCSAGGAQGERVPPPPGAPPQPKRLVSLLRASSYRLGCAGSEPRHISYAICYGPRRI
eukprot:2304779-Rhodomonas_salina.1